MSIENANAGRAADVLFRTFADQIRLGQLKEGEALPPEREIVERYGVSRTVAREALQALASRGLIEARPRHRPIVRRPSYEAAFETVGTMIARLMAKEEGVRALFEMRALIEVALARQAAKMATKTQVIQLEKALEANAQAIDDSAAFYETDRGFHAVFYEIPGNPALEAAHKGYATWLHPQWSIMPRHPQRNKINYEAHAAVFKSVHSGDADAAEDAMRAHMDAAWKQVCKTF